MDITTILTPLLTGAGTKLGEEVAKLGKKLTKRVAKKLNIPLNDDGYLEEPTRETLEKIEEAIKSDENIAKSAKKTAEEILKNKETIEILCRLQAEEDITISDVSATLKAQASISIASGMTSKDGSINLSGFKIEIDNS
jgi:galactokinase